MLSNLIHNYTNSIFKILPMKQEQLNGADNHLQEHIKSQTDELLGCMKTFPELAEEKNFVRVVITMQGVEWESADITVYRREILKILNLLNKAESYFRGIGK